jgi:hypothetical protein
MVGAAIRPPVFDDDVLTLDVLQVAKASSERVEKVLIRGL